MKTSISWAAALSRSSRMVDALRGATISAIALNSSGPHPEERPLGRVSKDDWHDRGLMVRDGASPLLTMRDFQPAALDCGCRLARRSTRATRDNRYSTSAFAVAVMVAPGLRCALDEMIPRFCSTYLRPDRPAPGCCS